MLLNDIIPNVGSNPVQNLSFDYCWFVPIIFWIMVLYFYLIKYFRPQTSSLIMALLTLCCLRFSLDMTGFLKSDYSMLMGQGSVRGFSTFGLGYFMGFFSEKYRLPDNRPVKILASILEIYLSIYLVHNMLLRMNGFPNNFLFILFFLVLFYLFLNKQGCLSKALDNNFSVILGRYSYSIYIMHGLLLLCLKFGIFMDINNLALASRHIRLTIFLITIGNILVGILTYHVIELPVGRYFTNLLNRSSGTAVQQS